MAQCPSFHYPLSFQFADQSGSTEITICQILQVNDLEKAVRHSSFSTWVWCQGKLPCEYGELCCVVSSTEVWLMCYRVVFICVLLLNLWVIWFSCATNQKKYIKPDRIWGLEYILFGCKVGLLGEFTNLFQIRRGRPCDSVVAYLPVGPASAALIVFTRLLRYESWRRQQQLEEESHVWRQGKHSAWKKMWS